LAALTSSSVAVRRRWKANEDLVVSVNAQFHSFLHFVLYYYFTDMAGSKSSITGEDYYGAYDAQDLAKANAERLGVITVPSLNLVYTAEEDYVTADYAKEKGLEIMKLSGTKFRQMLRGGEDIPEWYVMI